MECVSIASVERYTRSQLNEIASNIGINNLGSIRVASCRRQKPGSSLQGVKLSSLSRGPLLLHGYSHATPYGNIDVITMQWGPYTERIAPMIYMECVDRPKYVPVSIRRHAFLSGHLALASVHSPSSPPWISGFLSHNHHAMTYSAPSVLIFASDIAANIRKT